MSLHDGYARRTPYELLFPDPHDAEALVARVTEEAAGRGADPSDPHAFITLGSVASFVRGLEGPGAPPGAIHQYGALAFHAVHFERAGRPLYLMTTHVARYLVEGWPAGRPTPPSASGYLQLPQHLFWAEPEPGTAPESVDGIFWTATARGSLHALLAIGLRPDRPGLAVVPLPEAPLSEAPDWLDADVRGDGSDFTSAMPGSELDRLYAFRSAGEPLKLLARLFAYLEGAPTAGRDQEPAREPAGPAPSTIPFTRVILDA